MISLDSLKDKRVFVAGGAKRLGASFVTGFASLGMDVSFSYHESHEAAQNLENSLNIKALKTDLTSKSELQRLITNVAKCDVFIYNAGIFEPDPPNLNDRFDYYIDLHMRAPLILGMALGKQMKQRGWGRIIYVLDRTIITGQVFKNRILYTASKHGLYGIAQALALELSPEVTVNSIAPGFSLAPANMSPKRATTLVESLPIPQSIDPQELFEDILHLIRSEHKTGSTLTTDGGANLRTHI